MEFEPLGVRYPFVLNNSETKTKDGKGWGECKVCLQPLVDGQEAGYVATRSKGVSEGDIPQVNVAIFIIHTECFFKVLGTEVPIYEKTTG